MSNSRIRRNILFQNRDSDDYYRNQRGHKNKKKFSKGIMPYIITRNNGAEMYCGTGMDFEHLYVPNIGVEIKPCIYYGEENAMFWAEYYGGDGVEKYEPHKR